MIDISVVTVAYECRDLLDAMLASLDHGVSGHTIEVIVVDNASSDGVVEKLRRERPAVTLIEMGENAGFARANNQGIAAARGRHVMLLNPDTVARAGALDVLARFLDDDPRAAVAAPRLVYPDLSDQGTARSFPTASAALFGRRSLLSSLFPRNRWTRRYLSGRERSNDVPFEVDWVSGAAMMVRRAAIARVGGLDEGFFMHWEDADWCHRIKDAGYSVHCVPEALVIHHEGGSRRGWPPRQLRAFHAGAYRYYTKHHAPQWWNPLRYVAGAGLWLRASVLIARYHIDGAFTKRPISERRSEVTEWT